MIIFSLVVFFGIIPILVTIRYYTTSSIKNELLAYVKSIKSPDAKIFDSVKHKDWIETPIKTEDRKPVKNTIFKIDLVSGKTVYYIVLKKSIIHLPIYDKPLSISMVDYMAPSELKFNRFVIYYSVFLFVFSLVLIPYIDYYKKANDPIKLMREKSAKDYNNGIRIINKKLDSVINMQQYLYVFTNDTFLQEAILTVNYDFQPDTSDYDFDKTGSVASNFQSFINDENEFGYNVHIKNKDNWLVMQNLNNTDSIVKFKVVNKYRISEELYQKELEKERKINNFLKRDIVEKPKRDRTDIAVFNKNELKKHELKDKLRRLFQPKIDLSDPDMLFYFTIYNKPMSEQYLLEYLPDFKEMYLKNQECSNCVIKKIKIVKHFSE